LNRQFRKVTKTTTIFPHDEALAKLLFLAAEDISKKWTMPVFNWGTIVAQLAILFPEKSHLLIHD
jgi:transposase-like protein